MKSSEKTKSFVQLSLFAALIFIMAFTPLGYILVPFLLIRATIIHVPVILGSLLLGPKKGAILGTLFGLTSLINNTINPTVTSFVFSPVHAYPISGLSGVFFSLVICFIPRILVGILPYYIYQFIIKILKNNKFDFVALGVAGFIGSLTNTLLVMNFIFFFFADSYATAANIGKDILYKYIFSIITFNGSIEAIIATILTVAIGKVLLKLKLKNN